MELQGRIIAALPEKSGVSARGEWKAQDFVIETHDQYPRKMVFRVFGADRLQNFNISVGLEVSVSFDIDAHEYNGRWFNDIRVFDVRRLDTAATGQIDPAVAATQFTAAPATAAQPKADPFSAPAADNSSADDLPF